MKIGILGVGHLGRIHLKCIQMIAAYTIVGFYDPNDENAQKAELKYGVKRYEEVEQLIDESDVIDIVTPTVTHYELAKLVIQKRKHLFIEKPITHKPEEALELILLNKKHPVKIQIGHVERFNPALQAVQGMSLQPMFIEAHRLALFNPRGTDVSVVLDLMIHDLDIVLHLVPSKLKSIHASGVAVVSDSPDICNARLEFENGCIANLTASRISMKQMRKVRFFQKDAYVSLDFLKKETQVIRIYEKDTPNLPKVAGFLELDTNNGTKLIHIDTPPVEELNAIKTELEAFANSIQKDIPTKVTIEEGYEVLNLAHKIIREIDIRNTALT